MLKHILSGLVLIAVVGLFPTHATAQPKNCPPGLAKKSPACVPPGLAKKGVTAREWTRGDRYTEEQYDRLEQGDRVVFDGDEYSVVERDGRLVLRRKGELYRLPSIQDGSDFVRIGDQILTVNRETREVLDVIRLFDLLMG